MTRPGVVFSKDRMVNDCCSHVLCCCAWNLKTQYQSTRHKGQEVFSRKDAKTQRKPWKRGSVLRLCARMFLPIDALHATYALSESVLITPYCIKTTAFYSSLFPCYFRLNDFGMMFAIAEPKTRAAYDLEFKEEEMKRLLALIFVLTLLVVTGTLVSADGQTRRNDTNNTSGTEFTNWLVTNGG